MRNRLATLLASVLASLVVGNTAHAEPEFVANFGTVAPDNTPWADQLRSVKERIERESNGRIQLKRSWVVHWAPRSR